MTATVPLAADAEPFHLDVEDVAPGALRVLQFSAWEAMNEVGSIDVLVATAGLDESAIDDVVGRPATLRVDGVDATPQRFHGVVRGCAGEGVRERGIPLLRLQIVPALAILAERVTCRIFQDLTTRQIVDTVLGAHGIRRRWDLARTLPARVYCVQYHESDLAFVRRMLAEEGIFFHLEHPENTGTSSGSRELVVLGDAPAAIGAVEGGDRLPLLDSIEGGALRAGGAHISAFRRRRRLAPTQALLRDYDFIHPRWEQRSMTEPRLAGAPPELDGRFPGRLGVYEHRMQYEEPDLEPADASRYLEQLRSGADVHAGESRTARLRPGKAFSLGEGEVTTREDLFTVIRVEHEGRAAELVEASSDAIYRNRFECIRGTLVYRPARPVRRLAQVTETATVVGPEGEEIHADPLGRVKVQFHWDLDGRNDAASSCWIRVAQPWAGPGWGHQFIPRIGMEVVVTFLGGDLDRPLITGAVYNTIDSPSFPIPSEVTRSGIKTRSTPGGEGFNELSFEDARGHEQIRLRAERNLDETVLVDHTTNVGRDQSVFVNGSQSTVVLGSQSVAATASRTVHVEGPLSVTTKSDRADLVHGDHEEEVVGNHRRRIGGARVSTVEGDDLAFVQGTLAETVEGPATRHIGTVDLPQSGEVYAHGSYVVGAGERVHIRAERSVLLECGDSMIELTPEGIRLRGRDIRTIATELASLQSRGSTGPSLVATDTIEIAASQVHLFSESSRLSLMKEAELTSDKKTTVMGGGAGLGLAGGATLAGGKVIVAGKGATLVLDAEAKLDGALVKLNCGGEGGGVSVEERDPRKLDTPREVETKKLHIRALDSERRPLPGKNYVLTVGGQRFPPGLTGADGAIEQDVPVEATQGQLTVWPETYPEGPRLRWAIAIQPTLPRARTVAGGRIRLANLAYYVGPPVDEIDERLEASIRQFQVDQRLRVTGKLDPETALRLEEVHGD